MPVSPEYLDYLLDMLTPLGPVQSKRMFGGAGLFMDGTMFGLIVDDVLYLKADEQTQSDFEDQGMGPFTYQKKSRKEPVALSYFEAPPDVIEDSDALSAWGRKAWEAARRAAK
ncbi:MAG: TfoX/Sxy family protein [Proteobacteria bacterium]|nr:TfoX/Sxy family protein [Pseudomonadota bacterium]